VGGVQVREGRSPSLKSLPLPLIKGKGIKGIGLINNLIISLASKTSKEYNTAKW
jgi:hypothetical protein